MPLNQPELLDQRPQAADADVRWLENLLRVASDWMTAAAILQMIGRPPTDDNKRWVRDLASRSEWVLSGPGSPGYKHMEHSKAEEIVHYKNALIGQGKDMIRRGIKIGRSAHKIFG